MEGLQEYQAFEASRSWFRLFVFFRRHSHDTGKARVRPRGSCEHARPVQPSRINRAYRARRNRMHDIPMRA